MHVFTPSFDWFTGLSASFLIGWSDYFGFGYMKTALKKLKFLSIYISYVVDQLKTFNQLGKIIVSRWL